MTLKVEGSFQLFKTFVNGIAEVLFIA